MLAAIGLLGLIILIILGIIVCYLVYRKKQLDDRNLGHDIYLHKLKVPPHDAEVNQMVNPGFESPLNSQGNHLPSPSMKGLQQEYSKSTDRRQAYKVDETYSPRKGE